MENRWISVGLLMPLIAVVASGCGLMPRPATGPQSSSIRTTATVQLHGKPLELHLAAPVGSPVNGGVLVIYASGDGGWFGTAVDMFKQIAADGYYTVGFSSRSFLRITRPRGTLVEVRELAAEYARISSGARHALGLDDRVPVILTGWSGCGLRGAGRLGTGASWSCRRGGRDWPDCRRESARQRRRR